MGLDASVSPHINMLTAPYFPVLGSKTPCILYYLSCFWWSKEVSAVFCDNKAFDRVWHNGLLLKLRNSGIQGRLISWLSDYLHDRQQRVVLYGALSDVSISAGVPQGFSLGPLLFLVYINEIVADISSLIRLFADDITVYVVVDDPKQATDRLNSDLESIHTWANQ